ncbi:hypothetical protein [Alteromonas sp. 009811495]|uniref:hypothetical protein n=1 Tax=Alteromonas sp. 009811495 TaxID=3002962 RepID=UPI00237D6D06|nr:hypothetical protein [Alteromonas sp. 009811495]WDT84698.1 hypothetical protein OZ660_12190 [Alteromonas sp. 009811495]
MLNLKGITVTLLCVLVCKFSNASDAYVRTVHQEGQGILRPIGESCFLYTPAHVVTKSQGVLVETRLRKNLRGELINTYPQDLALVKLDDSSACQESSWKDGGERVEAIISVISSGRMNYKHQQGRTEVYDVEITDKAVDSTFSLKLKDGKKFRKGMSGSIVTVGDYPIGMLLSVEGDTGTVLRMDTMADLSRRVILRYATDKERIELGDLSNRESQVSNTEANTKPLLKTNGPAPSIQNTSNEFKGSLSEGMSVDHVFLARGNTAYRITSEPQRDRVQYTLGIFDDAGNELFSTRRTWSDKKLDWGVGVTQPGEYILRVSGARGAGKYQFTMNTLATPEELISNSNIIGTNDTFSGGLSNGTVAEYKFLARGNTAYRITSEPQREKVQYSLGIFDDAGNELFSTRRTWSDKQLDWGVGVTQPGEYTLKIYGTSGAGRYQFTMNTLATPEELNSNSNIIGTNETFSGGLSDGTVAEYKFLARGNTAYRIMSEPQRDKVQYSLGIFDGAGNELFSTRRTWSDKELDWGVGVTQSGEYSLKIYGTSGAGQYKFKLNTIATPEELVSNSNIVGVKDAIAGALASGTFAEYKMVVEGNTAYHIVSEPQRDKVQYSASIHDESGNELFKTRRKWSNKKIDWGIGFPKSGTYILRINGTNGAGMYHFKLLEK